MIRRWMVVLLLITGVSLQAQAPNARVIDMWEQLNLRSAPDNGASVVAELPGRTPLTVNGRTRDNRWYQVQTAGGLTGWVGAGYVELQGIDQTALPILDGTPVQSAPDSSAAQPAAPQSQSSAPQTATDETATNGTVNAGLLNLRPAPSTDTAVITRLPNDTGVQAIGRSADNAWLQVRAGGAEGWVSAAYVRLSVSLDALPVVSADASAASNDAPAGIAPPPAGTPYYYPGARTAGIFRRGQQNGNRANVFSKVGDSITVADVMYRPMGYQQYNLGAYQSLQATINFFRTTTARNDNSFNNTSLAAQSGWTSSTVLDAQAANGQLCQPNESPLACEYRLTRPAVALIMFGSNDVAIVPAEQYAANMRVITEYSVVNGIIPVLSTIPPRRGYEPQTALYNQLIKQIAGEFGVPLWDYEAAMRTLPNDGLSEDGLHPSVAPGGFAQAANFTGRQLEYGYVIRNLTALQVLDALRRSVLQ